MVVAGKPRESILLIRRTERASDPWSGHWSFPGGRREAADRDLRETALRELREECGIEVEPGLTGRALAQRTARRRVGRFVVVAPFVFDVEREMATVLDSREAVESRGVALEMLRDRTSHALRPVPGFGREVLFPAIEMGSVPLWGFTYRLLVDWLGMAVQGHEAGFAAARAVLDFVVARGLVQRDGWENRAVRVSGAIPVAEVVEHFSEPAYFMPAVNRMEVGERGITVAGPEYEEYRICGS